MGVHTQYDLGGTDLIVKSITTGAAGAGTTGSANSSIKVRETTTNLATATTPLAAELTAAFGTPASLGRGFVAIVDENDADTNCFIVWTSDASWYWTMGTKAL